MYMHNVHQVLANRPPTEAEWEYAAAADVGQREYNIYKGQKKYPWSGSYTRSGKDSQEIS
jgi:formylglycine-generating enzyme required for sulfatase activity